MAVSDPYWSPEPVVGYRYWRVDVDGLRGVRGTRWSSPRLEAFCRWGVAGPVPHPEGECGAPPCGIYVLKDPQDLITGYSRDAAWAQFVGGGVRMLEAGVYGAVSLSGRVIEHERGYRAARARVLGVVVAGPRRLLVVDDDARLRRLFEDPYPSLERLAAIRIEGLSGGWAEARWIVVSFLSRIAGGVPVTGRPGEAASRHG